MVLLVEGRVMMDGAMDLGGFLGVEICGIEVGVVERTGRCVTIVVTVVSAIGAGCFDGLVGT